MEIVVGERETQRHVRARMKENRIATSAHFMGLLAMTLYRLKGTFPDVTEAHPSMPE